MSIFRSAFDRLVFGGTSKLRPYEIACVDVWKGTLPTEGVSILERQLKRFNLVQRVPGGRLVSLFDTKDRGFASWKSEDLFPMCAEEVSVARVWLRSAVGRGRAEVKADVILRRGRLASIQFNKEPHSLESTAEFIKIRSLIDAMRRSETAASISAGEVDEELRDFLGKTGAVDLRKPMSALVRKEFIETVDAKLPEDYVALMSATDGATIKNWRVYGLSQIRRIVQRTGNYYLLGEATDGRAIGVVQEGDDGKLYIISAEDDKPKVVGRLLLECI
jgi:hypothetical protein